MRIVKKVVQDVICFFSDWLENIEYDSDGNWWQRVVGAKAQYLWFVIHNSRLWIWTISDDN